MLPAVFIAPLSVPAWRLPKSMHNAHAEGSIRSKMPKHSDRNTNTAILPGMKAARNMHTADTANDVEPKALRPTLMP